jgi:hypothetical protein
MGGGGGGEERDGGAHDRSAEHRARAWQVALKRASGRADARAMLSRALVLAVLASLAAATPAAAGPAAPAAVAYFRPHPQDAAATVVVFRTSAALPARAGARVDGHWAVPVAVSPTLHCYLAQVYPTKGVRLGDRVRVRIGRHGSLLRATLRVQRMSDANARGGTLGCDADPASQAVVFGLYPTPQVEPDRWFFYANAGPYLKDLVWSGWGTPTATATGTYISDCASCGPREEYPVTVRVDALARCPNFATQAYDRLFFERAGGRLPTDPPAARRTLPLAADLYC